MAVSFSDLRKNRSAAFQDLTKKVESLKSGGNRGDEDKDKYWQPTVDKAGNGYAVIRFLPAPVGEEDAFVRMWDHGFQGPGGWYIEKSRTTINENDPVAEYNSELWNASTDDNSPERQQARKQKRRLSYISNILVVKDPANPENDGKVFLFKYGKKIWDKLQAAMFPEFEDEKPMNPFDLWEGANFKLKIRKVEGYRNYDKSEFDEPAPLFSDDDKLQKIWESEHSLKALVDPSVFKSYDELKKRLDKVLGLSGTGPSQSAASRAEDDVPAYTPPAPRAEAPKPQPGVAKEEDSDSVESFFAGLGDDD